MVYYLLALICCVGYSYCLYFINKKKICSTIVEKYNEIVKHYILKIYTITSFKNRQSLSNKFLWYKIKICEIKHKSFKNINIMGEGEHGGERWDGVEGSLDVDLTVPIWWGWGGGDNILILDVDVMVHRRVLVKLKFKNLK